MKLYLNTLSESLWEILNILMTDKVFKDFYLVGGTSLSLRLGHRASSDIDLFTDVEYGTLDFEKIENKLIKTFPIIEYFSSKEFGLGKSYFIGFEKNKMIKLDLFYTDTFVFPKVTYKDVRFSSIQDIAGMKIEVINNGGRKKDFWDVHELLERYSLEDLISFYNKRYPYGSTKDEILKKLVDFKSAEDDFIPNCFKDKYWEIIKLDIQETVEKSV